MSRLSILALTSYAMLLAGCAGSREMNVTPSSEAEMPAVFSYRSLQPKNARFTRAVDPRTGFDVRRMSVASDEDWVIVDTTTLSGMYRFTRSDPRGQLQGLIKDESKPVWGSAGTVRGLGPQIDWRRVTLSDPAQSCLAMLRSLRKHPEGGSLGTQQMATALYCRIGAEPLPDEEIPAIAAGLQTR